MLFLTFLLQIAVVHCFISDRTPINVTQISKYDSRYTRCIGLDKIVTKTIKIADSNSFRYSKANNKSQCASESTKYVTKRILDGLIVHEDLPESHWHEYKSKHNKIYSSDRHEMAALSKWRDNVRRVAQHNREFLEGKQSYSLHLNRLGDLDVKEYFKKFLKLLHTFPLFDPAEDHHKTTFKKSGHYTIPKKVDWRTKGFRPLREEQHDCGACYAFAVTHALQAQLYKKHGHWGELSPQQIIDCSYKDGNQGCNGGSLRAALRYASRDGLVKESRYPYMGKVGVCKHNVFQPRVKVRRWATLPAGDESAITKALATIGPLAVAVNGAPWTFQLYRNRKILTALDSPFIEEGYRSGIYDDIFCTPWPLNHAMLLVGYTPDYWILLNWWGKDWGEDGYIRIRRSLNRCGVTSLATYVEL